MPFRKFFKNQKYVNEMKEIEHKFKAESIVTDGKVDTQEVTIYGDIGDFWWDSTGAADVKEVLNKNPEADIVVNINSPGGDVFEGIAIYNLLKNHPGTVTINIDGWAASAASIVAVAGDVINMRTGTTQMIHEAWTFAMGNKKDISSTLNALETIDSSLLDIYMTRFKGSREELEQFLANETWFTVEEAISFGLADQKVEVAIETDPEEFKNSVLARINKKSVKIGEQTSKEESGILTKFKRP